MATLVGGVVVTMAVVGATLGLRRSAADGAPVQSATPAPLPPAAAPARARATLARRHAPERATRRHGPDLTAARAIVTEARERRAPVGPGAAAADQPTSPADENRVPAFLRQNPYR